MGNTASNVSTGKPNIAGAVFVAPKGTTLPTDATTALDLTKYTCLGYVSEDGLENSNEMDVSTIKAWGGMIVYRSLNELNDEFSLALIESENVDVLKTVYGASHVTEAVDGTIKVDIIAEDPTEMVGFLILLYVETGQKESSFQMAQSLPEKPSHTMIQTPLHMASLFPLIPTVQTKLIQSISKGKA
jgi:hypothetical protein